MRFVLVHAPCPDDQHAADQRFQRWSAWYSQCGLPMLDKTPGTLTLSREAWLFDLDRALPKFGEVIAQADRLQIEVTVWKLDSEGAMWHSHLTSKDRKEALAKLLKGD